MKYIVMLVASVFAMNAHAWDSRDNIPLVTGIIIGSQMAPRVVVPVAPPMQPVVPYYNHQHYNQNGREVYYQRRGRTPMYQEVRVYDEFCECMVVRVEFVGYK